MVTDFSERARRLMNYLYARGSDEFHQFMAVLAENEQYEALAEKMKAGVASTISDKKYGKGKKHVLTANNTQVELNNFKHVQKQFPNM